MAQETGISWCDATFNIVWGCWPVSPGCALCYAARDAERYGWKDDGNSGPDLWKEKGPRRTFGEKYWKNPRVWAKGLPAQLGRRPRVFCSSMGDIGEDHPIVEQERPKLWRLIEETPELDWLLLTKRTATAKEWLPERWLTNWPPNAWFGFSAEDQQRFDERYRDALNIPSPVVFLSYEPALGPVDFRGSGALTGRDRFGSCPACAHPVRCRCVIPFPSLSWVIAGGESAVPANKARPSHPDWFRSARDQCVAAGVPFHFKQWGEWHPAAPLDLPVQRFGSTVALVGRKAAGRLLDGRTWDEFPVSPAGIDTAPPAGLG